jgi:AbrB family looped-hinge helix DNA binding protein
MPTATITSKGQITIPVSVRNQLGLEPGTLLSFTSYEDAFIVRPASNALASLRGIIPNNEIRASVEDMNDAIAKSFASAGLMGKPGSE